MRTSRPSAICHPLQLGNDSKQPVPIRNPSLYDCKYSQGVKVKNNIKTNKCHSFSDCKFQKAQNTIEDNEKNNNTKSNKEDTKLIPAHSITNFNTSNNNSIPGNIFNMILRF
jgi:hypothetical protein